MSGSAFRAAVEAGADAVFFGVNFGAGRQGGEGAGFHARAKVGFDAEALPEIMRGLHVRGVQAFVTFNVLVFDRPGTPAVRCALNLGSEAVRLDLPGRLLLASDPVSYDGVTLELPADTAAWLVPRAE